MNKEKRKEYMKQWRIDNAEHIKQYRIDTKKEKHEYYEDHKEETLKRSKKNYEANKIEILKQQRKYKKDNEDKIKEQNNKYFENNKDKIKENAIIRKFGLTLEQYNKLLEKQNNCCAICGKHQSELKRALAIDHNHTTGKIRGLLCYKCNLGLGYFNNKNILNNAGSYLNEND